MTSIAARTSLAGTVAPSAASGLAVLHAPIFDFSSFRTDHLEHDHDVATDAAPSVLSGEWFPSRTTTDADGRRGGLEGVRAVAGAGARAA